MIPYILIIITATSVSSIEFNSAATCYDQKERIEKVLPKSNITCIKK